AVMASEGNSFADVYNLAFAPNMLLPNQFSNFKGKPIPMPGYSGTPTDAQGRPIQSYLDAQSQHDAWSAANPAPAAKPPGTTLNSNTGWNQNPVGSPLNPMGDWTQLAPSLPGGNQQQQ